MTGRSVHTEALSINGVTGGGLSISSFNHLIHANHPPPPANNNKYQQQQQQQQMPVSQARHRARAAAIGKGRPKAAAKAAIAEAAAAAGLDPNDLRHCHHHHHLLHHYYQQHQYGQATPTDKLEFATAFNCTATAKAAVQWVCFPSLLSPVDTMPGKFSRSADVVMIEEGGGEDVKMDTSPPTSYHTAVDLFRVDVVPVVPQSSPQLLLPQRPSAKCPLKDGCPDHWSWNRHDKSHEVRLHGPRGHSAHFHPNWSNGTAGVRGSKVLNGGRHYWEIKISQRVFGTSMMFGVSTKRARLHVDAFVNLLGEDDQSWGLSHKGLLWHDGKWRQYTQPFRENEATVIGLLFDGNQGTLTCYKDGNSMGIAFSGLNKVEEELFPTICSTAAKTEMSLGATMRGFTDLQDRCRAAIISRLKEENSIDTLPLPNRIKEYMREGCH